MVHEIIDLLSLDGPLTCEFDVFDFVRLGEQSLYLERLVQLLLAAETAYKLN